MTISDIKIKLIEPRDKHVGWCTFVMNNEYFIANIQIHDNGDGTIKLIYPADTLNDMRRTRRFYHHPTTKEAGEYIRKEVERLYLKLIAYDG